MPTDSARWMLQSPSGHSLVQRGHPNLQIKARSDEWKLSIKCLLHRGQSTSTRRCDSLLLQLLLLLGSLRRGIRALAQRGRRRRGPAVAAPAGMAPSVPFMKMARSAARGRTMPIHSPEHSAKPRTKVGSFLRANDDSNLDRLDGSRPPPPRRCCRRRSVLRATSTRWQWCPTTEPTANRLGGPSST
jgi:hypothetical protein